MTPTTQRHSITDRGFTVIELLISMAIMVVILGTVMETLTQALRANQTAVMVTGMNANLRTAMDLIVRDMLQVGQDLPTGRVVLIPFGGTTIRLPGPPGSNFTTVAADTQLTAVMPGPGAGPSINGVSTDIIRTLAADSSFSNIDLSALTNTTMTVVVPSANPAINGANIGDGGVDDIKPGQLIMLTKGAFSTLVEATSISGQTVTFADGDSMRLNQSTVTAGTLRALNTAAPDLATQSANAIAQTQATRVRMITYYLDITTTPGRPRLVRRMNNGDPTSFNNTTLGSAVGFDVENLFITYDLNDGSTNPSAVRMNAADLAGTGACAPNACSPNQIRKVNITLTGRSAQQYQPLKRHFRNTLTSQVSLRALAFVDEYTSVLVTP
jgi:prepilin-type N-terminal cleavage/methylation domain-containing protein